MCCTGLGYIVGQGLCTLVYVYNVHTCTAAKALPRQGPMNVMNTVTPIIIIVGCNELLAKTKPFDQL